MPDIPNRNVGPQALRNEFRRGTQPIPQTISDVGIHVADYATLQLAADAAAGNRLIFPVGQTYVISGSPAVSIVIPGNCYVEGNGSVLKFADNTTANSSQSDEILKVNGSNVTLDNLNFDGNSANQSGIWSQHRHCVRIAGAFDNVTVKHCDMSNLIGDGVYISTQTHGNITVGPGNTFTAKVDARNGVSVVTGTSIEVYQNKFTTISRNDMPGCVDIEPNVATDWLQTVDVHDNVMIGGSTGDTGTISGIVVAGQQGAACYNVKVRNNDISGIRFNVGVLIVGANGGPFSPMIGIVVDGNSIHDIKPSGNGVEFDWWIGADVTNNTFNGMDKAIYSFQACPGVTTGNTYIGVTTNFRSDDPKCQPDGCAMPIRMVPRRRKVGPMALRRKVAKSAVNIPSQSLGTALGYYGWHGHSIGKAFGDVPVPGLPANRRLDELADTLLHGDPVSRAIAADDIAEFREFVDRTWIVTIYDFLWRPIGSLGDDIMQMSGTMPRNDKPSLTLKIKGDCQHIEVFKACKDTMVGITVETGALRLAYYVDVFEWEYDGAWTGTAHCVGIWDILNYLQIWPNFLAPIQAQVPSHAIFMWGLCTVLELMIGENALRIQLGLNEFINNALSLNPDIRAWFGTLLQSNGNLFEQLKTPIYVMPINPFLDTSPFVARTVRFESCGTVIKDLTRAHGVVVSVDLWLPGDDQPDEWTRTIPFLTLDQPTYVVSIKDRSQIEGPTKTIIDSALRSFVDLAGSFFGDIGPFVATIPGMEGVFVSPVLGVNFVPPWAIVVAPDRGEKGSVATCKLSYHTQKGWQHIIGGRSPKWLNDLMNALFGWIIDSISILVGLIGIPSNLLDGFLNNAFLAFQLIEHYGRRNQAGPYHPCIEVMHPTPTAPYNIETVFGFVNALWDSRGYVSGQFTFRDGDIYRLGKDIFPGGLVSLVYDGRKKIYTDYVTNVEFLYTPDARDVWIQVGDGKAQESSLAKHQRFITAAVESINVLTFAPQS